MGFGVLQGVRSQTSSQAVRGSAHQPEPTDKRNKRRRVGSGLRVFLQQYGRSPIMVGVAQKRINIAIIDDCLLRPTQGCQPFAIFQDSAPRDGNQKFAQIATPPLQPESTDCAASLPGRLQIERLFSRPHA